MRCWVGARRAAREVEEEEEEIEGTGSELLELVGYVALRTFRVRSESSVGLCSIIFSHNLFQILDKSIISQT